LFSWDTSSFEKWLDYSRWDTLFTAGCFKNVSHNSKGKDKDKDKFVPVLNQISRHEDVSCA